MGWNVMARGLDFEIRLGRWMLEIGEMGKEEMPDPCEQVDNDRLLWLRGDVKKHDNGENKKGDEMRVSMVCSRLYGT